MRILIREQRHPTAPHCSRFLLNHSPPATKLEWSSEGLLPIAIIVPKVAAIGASVVPIAMNVAAVLAEFPAIVVQVACLPARIPIVAVSQITIHAVLVLPHIAAEAIGTHIVVP